MKMKAAVFLGVGKPLQVRQVDVPRPGPGQLLVRVKRCGICGSDLHLTDPAASWQVPCGTVLGHEFSGEVVELGEGAGAWRVGDRLAALPYIGCGHCLDCLTGHPHHCAKALSLPTGDLVGAFGEYAVVGAREVARLDDRVSWEQAAFTEPLAVGLHAIVRGGLRPGDTVLIIGAGPIGLSAAACARAMGARRVVVSARSMRRADLAVKMGATAFLPSDERLAEDFARHAGGPPDLVVECAGSPGVLDQCAALAAKRGTVVVAGGCNGVDPLNVIPPTFKELTLRFSICYTIREFAQALDFIADRRIDPLPMFDGLIALDDLPSRFERLRQDKNACKIMVAP